VIWMSNHFQGRRGKAGGKREFYFYRVFRGNCMLCDKMNIAPDSTEKSLCGTNTN
jgi:hypothetical protein